MGVQSRADAWQVAIYWAVPAIAVAGMGGALWSLAAFEGAMAVHGIAASAGAAASLIAALKTYANGSNIAVVHEATNGRLETTARELQDVKAELTRLQGIIRLQAQPPRDRPAV